MDLKGGKKVIQREEQYEKVQEIGQGDMQEMEKQTLDGTIERKR